MRAANQRRIEDGTHVIPLTFHFANPQLGTKVAFKGLFYEADIPVDVIWSNGWMGENKIIPLPEFSQLGVRNDNDIFVLSPKTKKMRSLGENHQIDTTPMRLFHNKQPQCHEVGECFAIENAENVVLPNNEEQEFLELLSKFDFIKPHFCPSELGKEDTASLLKKKF